MEPCQEGPCWKKISRLYSIHMMEQIKGIQKYNRHCRYINVQILYCGSNMLALIVRASIKPCCFICTRRTKSTSEKIKKGGVELLVLLVNGTMSRRSLKDNIKIVKYSHDGTGLSFWSARALLKTKNSCIWEIGV